MTSLVDLGYIRDVEFCSLMKNKEFVVEYGTLSKPLYAKVWAPNPIAARLQFKEANPGTKVYRVLKDYPGL